MKNSSASMPYAASRCLLLMPYFQGIFYDFVHECSLDVGNFLTDQFGIFPGIVGTVGIAFRPD